MSTTLNVKGNCKIVIASYTTEAVFKIPDGLDLEDKTGGPKGFSVIHPSP